MHIEYKTVDAEVKSVDEKGEGVLRFIRFHQEDKDSDITLPGFVGQQEAILISAHNWKSDYPPLGRGESFEDDGATNFRFRLNLDDERARSWHSWLTLDRKFSRPLQQVSYGFSVHPDGMEYGQKDGRRVRFLKPRADASPGATLHEVSFVTVGSGNDTAILDLKSAHPLPATRRYWPGGVMPMKGVKEHVSEAMTSVRSGLRHLHQVRRVLAKSPAAAKVDEDFDTAMEHFESVLDLLNDASLLPVEAPLVVTPLPVVAAPKDAAVVPPESTAQGSDEEPEETDAEKSPAREKGGMPIYDDLEQVMQSLERVTDRLEQVKGKRAEESARYPHGRPMSAERLGQVETLMTRLSRLKVSAAQTEQHSAEQQELHEMTERLKRLGVTV